MIFIFKKIVGALLLPLPISLLLIVIGLILLSLSKYKTSAIISLFGFLILLAFSSSIVSFGLLHHLEAKYQPLTAIPNNVSKIVVLGGGVGGNPNYPANTRLSSASLSRLVEAVRLYRKLHSQNKPASLILSGGRVFRSPAASGKMRNTAILLGLNPSDIILEDGSQDTQHEALFIKKIVGNTPFILVTSAYHMRRALALFKALGAQPIPAPTQYLARSSRYRVSRFLPSASNLVNSDIAIHEYLGILWAKLNGNI